jgi:hypothetical protein
MFKLSQQDRTFLNSKCISEDKLNSQLQQFKLGFPFLRLFAAASPGEGIKIYNSAECAELVKVWESYITKADVNILKFVPASGAASRMFKDLFEFLDGDGVVEDNSFAKIFFDNINKFVFYDDLNVACKNNAEKSIEELIQDGEYQTIINVLLNENGMSYGKLPKGLLKFHKYDNVEGRTPMEEHLVEGALYAKSKTNRVAVHFTVSSEHRELFEDLVKDVVPRYSGKYGVDFDISFSEQKQSTDTIAVTMDNIPFRTDDGNMLFRPGGHGALIENLNDLNADIIFIKNIDNVVPDRLKNDTITYKKVIGGVLVSVQEQIFKFLNILDSGLYTHAQIEEMIHFAHDVLCLRNPKLKHLEDSELAIYLRKKFNRPIRVCGMVKNVGEPGGGPFLVYNQDGTISPQILESSQIDSTNSEYVKMFKDGTHFNPVDIVCAVRDYKGLKFNLTSFVDSSTGFISYKSKDGKELKALELPGLWNGSMSDWNTIFVDVPLGTFNPVKTVNDLLRDQHQ